MKNLNTLLAPYPFQGRFMSHLKAYPPTADTNPNFKAYWAGQAAGLLRHKDATALIAAIVHEMSQRP